MKHYMCTMTTKSEYNSDELNPPEWLNADFFKTALKAFKKSDSVVVKNLILKPGTKPGEHYASVMFRAEVTYTLNHCKETPSTIQLILKTMPTEEGAKMELLKETTAFKTEMRMYKEILPEMQQILAQINDNTIIAPTLVYQSNFPAPVIVFIDESPNGFVSYTEPLNLEQIQVVIERIAKFHACSVYMNENGFYMTTFNDCPYQIVEGRSDFLEDLFMPSIRKGVQAICTWKDCEIIGSILAKNLEVFPNQIRDLFLNTKKRMYSVLSHGDFHFKNMMYRNSGLKSEDYLLIDFQFCQWNTPANDIFFLLNSISDHDVRANHRQFVIQSYFQIFRSTLEKLGYKGPILRLLDLQMELLRCELIEYMYYIIFVPFQYVDWANVDVNAMMETKDFHTTTKSAWTSPDFQNNFIKFVTHLIEIGVFEDKS
uniref:CSON009898 protein n=1 Tax=Culicoides sonorensis TaxID=179676 RepID=A0A336M155_CULSO